MRQWHDDYGDCDVSPGDPQCLCCWKLWQENYCQFIPTDLRKTKEAALKTLRKNECTHCENNPDSFEYKKWHQENPRFSEACLFKCGFKTKGEDKQQKLTVFQKEGKS